MAHVIGDVTQSQLAAAVAGSVTVRLPAASDDSMKGYSAGSLWLTDNGEIYECLNATEGKARWYRRSDINGLAGDIVTPMRVYGVKRLVAAYTGPALRIRRASDDAEIDIYFGDDGGLDYATADAHIKGTTGHVTKWYDQMESGADLVQTTGANQPWFPPVAFLKDGTRGVFFNNEITQGDSTPPDHYMDFSGTTTFSNHTMSGFFVSCAGSSLRNMPVIFLDGGSNDFTYGQSAQNGVYDIAIRDNSFRSTKAGVHSDKRFPISPLVHGFVSSPSAASGNGIYWGDEPIKTLNPTPYTDTLTATYIGRSPGFTDGGGDEDMGYGVYQAIILYDSYLSASDAKLIQAALHKDFGLYPQTRDQIIFDGDSISEGAYATWYQSYARRVWMNLSRLAHVYNVAASGATVDTALSYLPQWDDIIRDDGRKNIVISAEGTNDLSAGDTAAASYATLTSKIAALNALGYDNIGMTLLPRTSLATGSKNTELLAFNAYLRANYVGMGYSRMLDPIINDPIFSTASVDTDTTYYQSDGTHLQDKGYGVVEPNITTTINAMLEE